MSKYSFGYDSNVLDYLSYRALKSFGFVLPHLKPGAKVLECGCGLGIVTFEIAKNIGDGFVTGIDIDKNLIKSNNEKIKMSDTKNIKFEVADVLNLPYPDNSFDIVYLQALLFHVQDPSSALSEIRRVLKNNGTILVKEPNMDRMVFSPENPVLENLIDLFRRAVRSYGGDPTIGRKLWELLNEAGFKEILMSMSWEQPESLDEWPEFYKGWVNLSRGKWGEIILEQGWIDEKELDEIRQEGMRLANSRQGFVSSAWGQAVAKK